MENKLPEEYQLLVDWVAWINWDMRHSLSVDTYYEYLTFIDWLGVELYRKFDINGIVGSEINQGNFMNYWFEFDSKFDKDSLLEMEAEKEYEIKKRYGRYTMIELKAIKQKEAS